MKKVKLLLRALAAFVFLGSESYLRGLLVAAGEPRNLGSILEHLEQIASFWKLSKVCVGAKHNA